MKHTIQVTVKGKPQPVDIIYANENKPEISLDLVKKWQNAMGLIQTFSHMPVVRLSHIVEASGQVWLKPVEGLIRPEDTYEVPIGKGSFSENALGLDQLYKVEDATLEDSWENTPEYQEGYRAYLGLALKWPDHAVFGTLSILQKTPGSFTDETQAFMQHVKDVIEGDLDRLILHQQMTFYAERDALTACYNRRKTQMILMDEFNRSVRSNVPFSIALFEIENLKSINENYGHAAGDQLIIKFAQAIGSRVRKIDSFGRWGNDEFLLICPNTDRIGVATLIEGIADHILKEMQVIINPISYQYGIAEVDMRDETTSQVITRAGQSFITVK